MTKDTNESQRILRNEESLSHKIIEINSMRNMTNQNIIYITTIRRSLEGINGERSKRAGRSGRNRTMIRVLVATQVGKPQKYRWNQIETY